MLAPGALEIDLEAPLAHYAEHGFARLGRVVNDAALAALRTRVDDLMLGRVVHPGLFFQLDGETGRYEDLPFGQGYRGPSLAYRKLEKLELDPLFRAFLGGPFAERVARRVLGPAVSVYRSIVMTKAARGGTELPWHQDAGRFWGLDRDPELQIWLALDDAPAEAGCVEVLAGSHRAGLATPLGGIVPRAHVEAADADLRALALPARAGEVLLIHNLVWHRSGTNSTPAPRRALSVCYLDAATRCTRKKRAPRTFFRVFDDDAVV